MTFPISYVNCFRQSTATFETLKLIAIEDIHYSPLKISLKQRARGSCNQMPKIFRRIAIFTPSDHEVVFVEFAKKLSFFPFLASAAQ